VSRPTTQERLIARLREIGINLPEGARLVRTHANGWQLSEGAWSWAAIGPDGRDLRIGSQYSMGELLRAWRLEFGPITSGNGTDLEVDPWRCSQCSYVAHASCQICNSRLCRNCMTDHQPGAPS
jgi:hypothetical protein